jgi:hypothetical protein
LRKLTSNDKNQEVFRIEKQKKYFSFLILLEKRPGILFQN